MSYRHYFASYAPLPMGDANDRGLLENDPAKRHHYSAAFLELFYPVHYRIGIGIEDAMRQGRLTRHEVAVLWLIRTEGVDGAELRRKDIERALTSWFEIQSSAISKLIRGLTKPPLALVELFEDPENGREKRVRLTEAGHDEINAIMKAGTEFIETMVDHLTEDTAKEGVDFLSKVSEIIELLAASPKPQQQQ